MTTFSDESTVDEQILNVYAQASALFEKHTTLDLKNNYHFGVADLTRQLLGMDSSDLPEIARIISEGTVPTREQLDEVINRHFPNRLLTFYTEGSFDVAAVEDHEGNMWRVWADGDTQKYTA